MAINNQAQVHALERLGKYLFKIYAASVVVAAGATAGLVMTRNIPIEDNVFFQALSSGLQGMALSGAGILATFALRQRAPQPLPLVIKDDRKNTYH